MKNFWLHLQELPPDLDEVFRRLKSKLNKQRNKDSQGSPMNSFNGFPKLSKWLVGLIVLVVFVLIFAFDMFYIVAPAQKGIEQRFGEFLRVTDSGPHIKLPFFIDKVTKVNTEEILAISYGKSSGRTGTQNVMLTSDENIIEVVFVVQYRIIDPVAHLFNISQPNLILSEALESAMRMVVGQSVMDDIIQQPAEIALRSRTELQNLVNHYKMGIEITSLNIQDVLPPSQVREAYDDAVKAREDLQRSINEAQAYSNDVLPKARGNASRIVEEAKAYKKQVTSRATGEADRFTKIVNAYKSSPESTKQRLYIETMESIYKNNDKVFMTNNSGQNNLFVLPLDRLLGQKSLKNEVISVADLKGTSDFSFEENLKSQDLGSINLRDRIRIRR